MEFPIPVQPENPVEIFVTPSPPADAALSSPLASSQKRPDLHFHVVAHLTEGATGVTHPEILSNTVYALDSTTIDLCLSLSPWAPFRSTKTAVKLHTLLNLRRNIQTFLHISDGKLHNVNILDQLIPEAGAFYIVDRGYIDFEHLARFDQAGAFFVTRAKRGMRFKRLAWRKTDRSTGVICDHTIALTVFYSKQGYPKPLRRIRLKDPGTGKSLLIMTNHLDLQPLTVCQLYKMR